MRSEERGFHRRRSYRVMRLAEGGEGARELRAGEIRRGAIRGRNPGDWHGRGKGLNNARPKDLHERRNWSRELCQCRYRGHRKACWAWDARGYSAQSTSLPRKNRSQLGSRRAEEDCGWLRTRILEVERATRNRERT